MGVRDYRELDAWRLADEARRRIWVVTARSGFRDHLWLRTQLRKASNSSCANIAEGFARYRPADFGRFLNVAKGSLSELLEHLVDAVSADLVTDGELAEIRSLVRRSRGAIGRLVAYLQTAPTAGPKPAKSNE